MDAALFARMLSDPSVTDWKKLQYKYPQADLRELVALLKSNIYKPLPLPDFQGESCVYMDSVAQVRMGAVKTLLRSPDGQGRYGRRAMEEEISATLTIENVDFSRDSVRKIMGGYAPEGRGEERVYGMKKGLEFISDPAYDITEENIHRLYQMTVGEFLEDESRLLPGRYYRHDEVYVVGQEIEHTGLPYGKLPAYMTALVDFIHRDTGMNDLLKAAAIHFYVGYLHPWFDGNGRMARLLHLWYLVRQGYSSALFVPFSSYVEQSRKKYYDAYTRVEENRTLSGVLDITPFLVYFIENVYDHIEGAIPERTAADFREALGSGHVTEKERDLWAFVLSAYGDREFSTKQLEKDFGNAAYATIHKFVGRFTELGLLTANKYGNRTKYRIKA